jgi:hypothetical protein
MPGKGLSVGAQVKEIATRDTVYANCSVISSDEIGVAFEVERTLSEGGNVETVVSQVFVPWMAVNYVLLDDSRT